MSKFAPFNSIYEITSLRKNCQNEGVNPMPPYFDEFFKFQMRQLIQLKLIRSSVTRKFVKSQGYEKTGHSNLTRLQEHNLNIVI